MMMMMILPDPPSLRGNRAEHPLEKLELYACVFIWIEILFFDNLKAGSRQEEIQVAAKKEKIESNLQKCLIIALTCQLELPN